MRRRSDAGVGGGDKPNVQIPLLIRATFGGAAGAPGEGPTSAPVDLEGVPRIVVALTVYSLATLAATQVEVESSEDGEVWSLTSGALATSAVGNKRLSLTAKMDRYGRYVRTRCTVGGPANAHVAFSIWIETFEG